ncbi:MAG: hypothetical protein HYZ27_04235, partial [Deltaproteobacteria bacterium]|nr:hypothetical protein [Deltaproteobacteria bacterium]
MIARVRVFVLAHPLAAPLMAGAVARGAAAIVAMGFHARDDYFHVLEPALAWLKDPAFDWDNSPLAGAGIRSHLVPRAVWLVLMAARTLGIASPENLIRATYLAAGAYSLLAVPAMFLAARRLLDAKGALIATWLAAVHFAMPYAGTRLLIEAMAMPPLLFGIYFATFTSARRLVLAGACMALACWFRYHVAVAALALAAVVGVSALRTGGLRSALARLAWLATGAGLALAVQGLFDLWTTGDFLGPLVRNIAYNLSPPAGLSRSGPLTYLGLWLLLTAPPATLVLLPAMSKAARALPLVTWPFVAFVVFHSLVPHKEERFMLPVLPLFLILLAAAPAALKDLRGRWARLAGWWRPTRGFLVVIHAAALLVAITSQSQASVRDAMIALRNDREAQAAISLGPEILAVFFGERDLATRRHHQPDASVLARQLAELADAGVPADRFLSFAADGGKAAILLAAFGVRCDPPHEYSGWWLDRLTYTLNPDHNRRRSPVLIWRCEPPALAAL